MSATDELRRLLDERGVEYRAIGDATFWETHDGAFRYKAESHAEKLMVMTCCSQKCTVMTPEQAIAATLGREPNDAAMVRLHDQLNATMLKYEMAQGIEKRDGDAAIVVPWVAKMHSLLEEAAMLGADAKPTQAESSGTCEMEYVSDWMSWHCKACDQMDMAPRNPKPRYCKWCGRKVVGE